MVSEINPYAPPSADNDALAAEAADSSQLLRATRSQRWWAAFIDNLLYAPLLGVGMFVASSLGYNVEADKGTWMLVVYACFLPLAIYQWALIAKTGQSLGKRWTKIKIFKQDGTEVDFLSGVVLRNWIVLGIPVLLGILAPEADRLGNLISTVDAVCIFGAAHRCLHDYIAGTQVLQLQRTVL
jgi:uncharacterized RDD family membrane protein YckC